MFIVIEGLGFLLILPLTLHPLSGDRLEASSF